ncbi:MAG: DUF4393 domain-containing protein [Oscillospiraceae bacterium]|jgi:hypothetical protein|nr:DUF4393 domain-containing protein [Oscillospiraceae bacterium]
MSEESKTENLQLKLFGPVAAAAGETLQDIWELVFGRLGNYVEKKRMVRRKALEDFKTTLEQKVNDIPEDQLREPPLSVVGPALDASKYYFEEEEIRTMFASLISASMDARTNSLVHPSFPTIIQQLSPLDAQNLAQFGPKTALPLCEYQIKLIEHKNQAEQPSTAPYHVIYTNVFLSNPKQLNVTQNAVSIATLSRLGLIETSYERSLVNADYKAFEQTDEYHGILSRCEKDAQLQPYIQHGCIVLTPLGKRLCAICFPDRSGGD